MNSKMVKVSNFKISVANTNGASAAFILNVLPTQDRISAVLEAKKREVVCNGDSPEAKIRYDRAIKHINNLIVLTLMANIKVPEPGKAETTLICVAGVEVGHINIIDREAWTTLEHDTIGE